MKKIFHKGETRKRIRVVLKKDGQLVYDRTAIARIGEGLNIALNLEIFFEKQSIYGELGPYKITLEELKHEREESEDDQEDGVWGSEST